MLRLGMLGVNFAGERMVGGRLGRANRERTNTGGSPLRGASVERKTWGQGVGVGSFSMSVSKGLVVGTVSESPT